MGKHANAEWYLESSKALIDQYGDVPPPWVYGPNYHPYSIGWRMGGGESHLMILWEWLSQQNFSFDDRLKYLQKYPNPPRWLQWIVEFLWDIDTMDFEDEDYAPYFKKLEELGFENVENFEKDFERNDLI
ncbi:hypothetical protein [Flammeovirga sp. SJP92]|uniref:hypothetical protein n=1 Tax=Flammeovirga sp. SJP92 TaxID=1775430 RepID=UPI000786C958|nr:hypothetical protein [Flammeovirga sp. SJP92]KXX66906.1 hypothetical protein AVL50_29820 [Flammeovirga sp. SJP92]